MAVRYGNKVVLQRGLKLSGMCWELEYAKYLLTLISKHESGIWEKDAAYFIIGQISKHEVSKKRLMSRHEPLDFL